MVPKNASSETMMRKRTQDRGKSNCKFPSTFMGCLVNSTEYSKSKEMLSDTDEEMS